MRSAESAGACLGTLAEILIAGPLDAVFGRIRRARTAARAPHGWLMDTNFAS